MGLDDSLPHEAGQLGAEARPNIQRLPARDSLLPKMRQISFRRQTRSGGGPHGDRLLGFNEIGLGDRLRPLREKPAAAQNVGSRLVR